MWRPQGRERVAFPVHRLLHSIAFSIVTVTLGTVFFMSSVGFILERNYGLAWLFTMRGAVEPPAEAAVIGIDGRSGSEMGLSRLPRDWPRSVYGSVLHRAVLAGARGVVFDFDFSRDKTDTHDAGFAETIRESNRTILFQVLEGRRERLVSADGDGGWVWREETLPPIPVLAEAARAVGVFPLPKIDKSSFQFWVFKPSLDDAPTTPALAVQLALLPQHELWLNALAAAGVEGVASSEALQAPGALGAYMKDVRKRFLQDPTLASRTLTSVDASRLEDYELSVLRVLVGLYGGPNERFTNFYGPPGTILTVPFHQLIKSDRKVASAGRTDPAPPTEFEGLLDGRTLFVGYSDLYEPDQPDRFHTVFTGSDGIDLSGVEIMATAFANLLHDTAVRPADALTGLAVVVLFGLLVSQLVFWPPAYAAVPVVLMIGAGYGYAASRVFADSGIWMPMVTPLALQLPFAIVAGLIGQYLLERRRKLRVGAAMAQYLPETLVRDLTAGRLQEASLNRVVHGVCLATDMSGFSTISEKKSPKELAAFMNAYFDAIAQALKWSEVDVTEFHADTIVCAWTGSADDRTMRRRALGAALAVVEVIERFGADDPELSLTARVGLQEGDFYLGHTGGGGRMSYSILGDPANGASRLEGLNKQFGTRILAAETVVADVDGFVFRPLGDFRVVGKNEVIPVIEVVGREGEIDAETDRLLTSHLLALQRFRAHDWAGAAEAFESLRREFPADGVSRFYLAIARDYAAGNAPAQDPTLISVSQK